MARRNRGGSRNPRRPRPPRPHHHQYQGSEYANVPPSNRTTRPVRTRSRRKPRWLQIVAAVLLLLLAWAIWADYSEHGNITPTRVWDKLLTPLSWMPDTPGPPSPTQAGRPDGTPQMPVIPVPPAQLTPTTAPTATMHPTKTPTPSPEERDLMIGRLTHELVNQARASSGVPALEYDEKLAQVARNHSKDMVASNYYSHDNLQGEGPSERASRQGYNCRVDLGYAFGIGIAENIFTSYGINYSKMAPAEVAQIAMDSWMGSGGHRRNILNRSYRKEGIGVAFARRTVYFTQNFC